MKTPQPPPRRDRRKEALISRLGVLSLLFLAPRFLAAQPAKPGPDADEQGRAIALELTSLEPGQSVTNTGTLTIRDKNRSTVKVPVSVAITPGKDGWQTIYETTTDDPRHAAKLIVHHSPGKPGRYELAKSAEATAGGANPVPLPATGLMVPFAGSDFWVADLGLEFLRWPKQRLLKTELRRSQSCNVLESVNTDTNATGYVRVVSWIDIDTGGIVEAEAYDSAGKQLKHFKPVSFQKLDGRWEVKEIEIRNKQTGSQTRLEFDLLASGKRTGSPAAN